MKKRDLLLIGAALIAALALYLVSQISAGGGAATVVVTIDGEEAYKWPLAVENTYEVRQEDGSVNTIRVEGGAVRMLEANCRDGLCIRQGRMKNAAKTIVCLPHRLVVRISGKAIVQDNSDLDVIIQ